MTISPEDIEFVRQKIGLSEHAMDRAVRICDASEEVRLIAVARLLKHVDWAKAAETYRDGTREAEAS